MKHGTTHRYPAAATDALRESSKAEGKDVLMLDEHLSQTKPSWA
jgi:hypothetical protein